MSEPLISITKKQAMQFAVFLVLYEFITYMANDMIMPGMLSVVHTFGAPETWVASSLTVYISGGASLQLFLGPLSDSFGRRSFMLIGAALFFVFTLIITCSQSIESFLIARFFQGMGLCFIGVIGYAAIQEMFDEMDAIRLIAIMANAAILAPLLGPLLGAVIIHYTSWRFIFILIAMGALMAFWGLWRFMPEPIGQTKKNGEVIQRIPLSMNEVVKNYKLLLKNPSYCLGAMAIGVLGIPCMAWIALAPIILISEAKLSVIQYGLWQLPVFGATILGNWLLHRLTYKQDIQSIVVLGSILLIIGLALMTTLPFAFGNQYYWLLPGVILYFFSLSIINAPLNRYALFVTSVGKGTASALISLSTMGIGGLGIELGNHFYKTHSNLFFGSYCGITGLFFLALVALTFLLGPKPEKEQNL